MPDAPHEYTLRDRKPGPGPAAHFVALINRYGYRARYGRTIYTYLHVDGWKYWSMGQVINRARL